MRLFWWLIWSALLNSAFTEKIQIDPDGGYTGIVVKISKTVPESECPKILSNLKVRTYSKFY